MNRLEGYIRVSAVNGREGEGYISPTVQRESIAAYAAELGGEIVNWHSDEDFTGGNTDRPGFQAALQNIRAGNSDGIIVMKIDRFARSVADGTAIVRELTANGKIFASCHERIDPTTPEGKFMLTAFLANGELFLDQSKAQWRVAKERAVKRGVVMGRVPFGYLRAKRTPLRHDHISLEDAAKILGETPTDGLFVPHPVQGPAVTELFQRAAAGETRDQLTKWLREAVPAVDRRPWAPSEIRRFLVNRAYLGEIRYGNLTNTNAHQPLTDPATFNAANPGPARRKRPSTQLPLIGIVYCAGCGNLMVGNSYGGPGHDTPIYRCMEDCPARSVIVARHVHDKTFEVAREALRGYVLGAAGVDLADVDQRIEKAEAELDAFISNLTVREALGEARWEDGVKLRADALAELQRERDAAVAADELLSVDLENPTEHQLRRFCLSALRIEIRKAPRGTPPADRITIGPASDIELPSSL